MKRLFSKKSFSLAQLDEICAILEIDFYDLAKHARGKSRDVQQVLTLTQEKAMAEEPALFVCFYVLLAGTSVRDIELEYQFPTKMLTLLLKLEKLELIQLYPQDRVRLLVSPNVRWNHRGPLSEKYEKHIKDEFLDAPFNGKLERLRFLSGALNDNTLRLFSEKVDRLIGEFIDLSQISAIGNRPEAKGNTWFLIAYRPWSLSIMSRYKKVRGKPS
jgi:hypothetical protein